MPYRIIKKLGGVKKPKKNPVHRKDKFDGANLVFEPPRVLALPIAKDGFRCVRGALTMKNISPHRVAYKFRTNHLEAYRVYPTIGVIAPNEILEFSIQVVEGQHCHPDDVFEIVCRPLNKNQRLETSDKEKIREIFNSTPFPNLQKYVISLTQGIVTSDTATLRHDSLSKARRKGNRIWSGATRSFPDLDSSSEATPTPTPAPAPTRTPTPKENSIWSIFSPSKLSIGNNLFSKTKSSGEEKSIPSSKQSSILSDEPSSIPSLEYNPPSEENSDEERGSSPKDHSWRWNFNKKMVFLLFLSIPVIIFAFFLWKSKIIPAKIRHRRGSWF